MATLSAYRAVILSTLQNSAVILSTVWNCSGSCLRCGIADWFCLNLKLLTGSVHIVWLLSASVYIVELLSKSVHFLELFSDSVYVVELLSDSVDIVKCIRDSVYIVKMFTNSAFPQYGSWCRVSLCFLIFLLVILFFLSLIVGIMPFPHFCGTVKSFCLDAGPVPWPSNGLELAGGRCSPF
jgi:hypothetical protein